MFDCSSLASAWQKDTLWTGMQTESERDPLK